MDTIVKICARVLIVGIVLTCMFHLVVPTAFGKGDRRWRDLARVLGWAMAVIVAGRALGSW